MTSSLHDIERWNTIPTFDIVDEVSHMVSTYSTFIAGAEPKTQGFMLVQKSSR